eukprot:IDg2830t1
MKARTDETDRLTLAELSQESRTATSRGFELQLIEFEGLISLQHKLAPFTRTAACRR